MRKHRRQKAVSAYDVALAACRALVPTEVRPKPDIRRALVLARFAVANDASNLLSRAAKVASQCHSLDLAEPGGERHSHLHIDNFAAESHARLSLPNASRPPAAGAFRA